MGFCVLNERKRNRTLSGHKKFPFSLKETTMLKNLAIMISVALLFFVAGCNIKTPGIRGVVLDAETKQPVDNAWVTATLGIKTKSVSGDVHNYLSVDLPHTRTDKNGRFIIPSKKFDKPFFPASFGTTVETFGVGANTVADKTGSVSLIQSLGKAQVDVTIYVKPEVRTESEYFSYLQALYNYCLTGRFFVEVPAVEGGCDAWELAYAISKHERYLTRLKEPKTVDQETHYAGTLKRLAYLYKREGDYRKSLDTFEKLRTFEARREVDLWSKEIENQIAEIEQLLHKRINK